MMEDVTGDDIVSSTSMHLVESPKSWKWVVAVGWWKMLRESPPVVEVDDALQAGFSPADWNICLMQCSWQLSLELADVIASEYDNGESLEEFLDSLGCSVLAESVPHDEPSPECFESCRQVLRWPQAVPYLESVGVKAVGFMWFVDFLGRSSTENRNAQIPDVAMVDIVIGTLESLLDVEGDQLVSLAADIEGGIPADHLNWTPSFVVFPFGV